jgi:regulator of sigma E protease
MLISIIAAAAVLGLLVLVHEVGHFLVAKWAGVRVVRFSIGYPPRIFGFRRGETDYSIGATPFGGYVKMLGDEIGDDHPVAQDVQAYLEEIGKDLLGSAQKSSIAPPASGSEEDRLLAIARLVCTDAHGQAGATAIGLTRPLHSDEAILLEEIAAKGSVRDAFSSIGEHPPAALVRRMRERSFPSQPLFKRVAIVLAGPLANVALAPVLLTVVFLYGVPRLLPVVGQVKKDLPAERAGLKPGDHIVSINGKPIAAWDDLSSMVKSSGGSVIALTLERTDGGQKLPISAVLQAVRDNQSTVYGDTASAWIIGVTPRGDSELHRVGPLGAVERAFLETGRITSTLVVGIVRIIDGSTPARQALGGPIMIAQLAGREARAGFASIALFAVMLSIELGIINVLPVPMLDGGHLLFFLFEGVRGRPLQLRHREIAQQVGLFLLVTLMAFVIINDISRIVQG